MARDAVEGRLLVAQRARPGRRLVEAIGPPFDVARFAHAGAAALRRQRVARLAHAAPRDAHHLGHARGA